MEILLSRIRDGIIKVTMCASVTEQWFHAELLCLDTRYHSHGRHLYKEKNTLDVLELLSGL